MFKRFAVLLYSKEMKSDARTLRRPLLVTNQAKYNQWSNPIYILHAFEILNQNLEDIIYCDQLIIAM